MKCENCGKNEVSFVYRSSINGRTEEHHLCQACAEKLGSFSPARKICMSRPISSCSTIETVRQSWKRNSRHR